MTAKNVSVRYRTYRGYTQVDVRAGRKRIKRVVPPAGEEYAFEQEIWDHQFTVWVSPTGRSVRLWIDGEQFKHPILALPRRPA